LRQEIKHSRYLDKKRRILLCFRAPTLTVIDLICTKGGMTHPAFACRRCAHWADLLCLPSKSWRGRMSKDTVRRFVLSFVWFAKWVLAPLILGALVGAK
jgi:hypothetical protein